MQNATAVPTSKYDRLPWNEKYRPQKLTDVCGQTDVVQLFNKILEFNQPMHLLLHGPPGTGKTSTITTFCHQIYDKKSYEQCVLNINASYERGIEMVRAKIKPFCKKSMHPFQYNGHTITYKFIILDEADTLTVDAQNALRRCIEMYSYNTRFCFLCNYISNIISPITSRCLTHQFKRVEKQCATQRLHDIAEKEGVLNVCSDDCIAKLYDVCRGDMRHCISSLEQLKGLDESVEDTHAFLNDIYNDTVPSQYWGDAISHHVSEHVALLRNSGKSCRLFIRQFINWVCERSIPTSHLYDIYTRVSCMEKQLLYISDTEPVLYQLAFWFNQYR
jgi:DNA polymerase III delta prime subunit